MRKTRILFAVPESLDPSNDDSLIKEIVNPLNEHFENIWDVPEEHLAAPKFEVEITRSFEVSEITSAKAKQLTADFDIMFVHEDLSTCETFLSNLDEVILPLAVISVESFAKMDVNTVAQLFYKVRSVDLLAARLALVFSNHSCQIRSIFDYENQKIDFSSIESLLKCRSAGVPLEIEGRSGMNIELFYCPKDSEKGLTEPSGFLTWVSFQHGRYGDKSIEIDRALNKLPNFRDHISAGAVVLARIDENM